MSERIVMSTLAKTWIFDLDGTLVKHNGYKDDGEDTVLPGVKEYLDGIPDSDCIVILTSRTDEFKESTIAFLNENGIRYDKILFGVPMGERILVNDKKPSGIEMAFAVNLDRNEFSVPAIKREL